MLDQNKLKAKIVERGLSIEEFSRQIDMNKTTFYRKITHNSFLVREVEKIAEILSLTKEEAVGIFFAL